MPCAHLQQLTLLVLKALSWPLLHPSPLLSLVLLTMVKVNPL
jgi:hypothetical protein